MKVARRSPPTIARTTGSGSASVSRRSAKLFDSSPSNIAVMRRSRRSASGAGGLGVDYDEVQRLRVRLHFLHERPERGPHALLGTARRRPVGLVDAFDPAMHDQVEGLQEAVFLVRELLVEGSARDACEADHVLDARVAVATRRDRLDHRPVHANPLVMGDARSRDAVGTLRQALVDGRNRLSRPRLPRFPRARSSGSRAPT